MKENEKKERRLEIPEDTSRREMDREEGVNRIWRWKRLMLGWVRTMLQVGWRPMRMMWSPSLLLRTMQMFLMIDLFLKTVKTGIIDSSCWLGFSSESAVEAIEGGRRKMKKQQKEISSFWWDNLYLMFRKCNVCGNGYFFNKSFSII